MKSKNKKGFMLVELIIVLAIIGTVITTIFGLLLYGYDVFTLTSTDFKVQTQVRMAMEKTNTLVRFSRALFAVPDVIYMDAKWNYIGMNSENTEIINYRWDSVLETHVPEIMVGPYPGVRFNIGFDKADNLSKDNTLRMYFETLNFDGSIKRYNIKSGYEALNSLQVVNYGTTTNPARALAYREDQYSYENFKLVVNIAMVLDVSGSMGSGLVDPNHNTSTTNPSRISVLETQSKMIVEKFAQNQNTDVSINMTLVPFSTYANTPSNFYDVKNATQKSTLLGKIDALSSNGYTNTGDGLRRAYYQLYNKKTADIAAATVDTIVKNYTIILVDGQSNTSSFLINQVCTSYDNHHPPRCTKTSPSTPSIGSEFIADGTIKACQIIGNSLCTPSGYYIEDVNGGTNAPNANRYVTLMGAKLSPVDFSTNYLVAFAKDVNQSEITYIANATAIPSQYVFFATSADQLGLSFTEIQMSITNDLWHFLGPKLTAVTN
jgi:uncharacterized protein YegL